MTFHGRMKHSKHNFLQKMPQKRKVSTHSFGSQGHANSRESEGDTHPLLQQREACLIFFKEQWNQKFEWSITGMLTIVNMPVSWQKCIESMKISGRECVFLTKVSLRQTPLNSVAVKLGITVNLWILTEFPPTHLCKEITAMKSFLQLWELDIHLL